MSHLERWLLFKNTFGPEPAQWFQSWTIAMWFRFDNRLTQFFYWWGVSAFHERNFGRGILLKPILSGIGDSLAQRIQ